MTSLTVIFSFAIFRDKISAAASSLKPLIARAALLNEAASPNMFIKVLAPAFAIPVTDCAVIGAKKDAISPVPSPPSSSPVSIPATAAEPNPISLCNDSGRMSSLPAWRRLFIKVPVLSSGTCLAREAPPVATAAIVSGISSPIDPII